MDRHIPLPAPQPGAQQTTLGTQCRGGGRASQSLCGVTLSAWTLEQVEVPVPWSPCAVPWPLRVQRALSASWTGPGGPGWGGAISARVTRSPPPGPLQTCRGPPLCTPAGSPRTPPHASRLVLAAHRGERGPWSWTIRPEEKPPPSPSFPSPTGGRVCTTCPGSLCPPQSVLAGQDRTALLSPCSLLPQASAGAAVGGAVLCPGLGWTLCSQSAPVWQGMSAP